MSEKGFPSIISGGICAKLLIVMPILWWIVLSHCKNSNSYCIVIKPEKSTLCNGSYLRVSNCSLSLYLNIATTKSWKTVLEGPEKSGFFVSNRVGTVMCYWSNALTMGYILWHLGCQWCSLVEQTKNQGEASSEITLFSSHCGPTWPVWGMAYLRCSGT